MNFSFNIDLGAIITNAIQGAVTGGCTAAVVLFVTKRIEKIMARDRENKRNEEKQNAKGDD